MTARSRFPIVLVLLAALLLPGGAALALGRSDGEKALAEFEEKGAVLDGELAAYVARVGARVARAAGLEEGRSSSRSWTTPP